MMKASEMICIGKRGNSSAIERTSSLLRQSTSPRIKMPVHHSQPRRGTDHDSKWRCTTHERGEEPTTIRNLGPSRARAETNHLETPLAPLHAWRLSPSSNLKSWEEVWARNMRDTNFFMQHMRDTNTHACSS